MYLEGMTRSQFLFALLLGLIGWAVIIGTGYLVYRIF